MQATCLDLRPLAPPQRHALALQHFEALAVGAGLELLSDHEPRGLLTAMLARHPGAFDWELQQAGPALWRVGVRRTALSTAGAAGDTPRSGCCACSCAAS